jgi:hypothetical protein
MKEIKTAFLKGCLDFSNWGLKLIGIRTIVKTKEGPKVREGVDQTTI